MTTTEIEQRILRKLRSLPQAKKQRALELVEALDWPSRKQSFRSSRGLWADLDISVSSSDIDEIRREMWADFPRDIEL